MKKGKKQEVEENKVQETIENQEEITQEGTEVEENTEDKKEETVEASLNQKLEELNDKYLRLYSDFENFRRRTSKEKLDIITHANEGILKDLLAVVDDFERAIANNQNSTDAESVKEGFQLIYNKLFSILKSKGLAPMESKGNEFDLDQHEAITNIPVEDESLKGKVVDVVEKGYLLNDKVIRYAKVVVGQ